MARDTLTVLHVSDLQCGEPFLPSAAEAMLRFSDELEPDVVVVAGDLTQRAKPREYRMAGKVLERFGDVPLVVTPGNHDIPVYRVWERAVFPYRNWRRFVGRELNTVTHVDGATFVTLNSSTPYRALVNGWIGDDQLDFARRSFESAPSGDFRVVVIHHNFVPVTGGEGGHAFPRAAHVARALEQMDVDVVLGGHVHRLHLNTLHDIPDAPELKALRPMPIVVCGTTASLRWRGDDESWNSLCVLRFESSTLHVEPYRCPPPDFQAFEPLPPVTFPLGSTDGDEVGSARARREASD